jgi:replicative DNA helicase
MSAAGDVEAERAVLSHYLVKRRADVRDAQVKDVHFLHGEHSTWWAKAESAVDGWRAVDLGIPVDTVALLAAIQPTEHQLREAEKRMIRRWQVSHIQRACQELVEDIQSGEVKTPNVALDRVRETLGHAEAGGVIEARTHREVGLALFQEWSEEIQAGRSRNLPMPLGALQGRLGGWRRGKYYLVGAITSAHKTTFARMTGWKLAQDGFRPLLWEMEDSAEELAARTFAAEVEKVNTRTFTTYERPEGITDDDFTAMIHNLGQHLDEDASSKLRYLDEGLPKLSRVLGCVSAEAAKGLDAVILDFMQLIQPDSSRVDETTHWFHVSNALAAMAKRLDIPVIATVQPTQMATREQARLKRPLTLGDLRGGSSIAQAAYGVFLLNRVWDEEGELDKRFIEVAIAKWKNADTDNVRFAVARHRDLIMPL